MANGLKAGSFGDFGNSMAAAMEAAMHEEWLAARGSALPGGVGEVDRKLLFAAVAKGVLRYLKAHQDEVLISITTRDDTFGSTEDRRLVTHLEINA